MHTEVEEEEVAVVAEGDHDAAPGEEPQEAVGLRIKAGAGEGDDGEHGADSSCASQHTWGQASTSCPEPFGIWDAHRTASNPKRYEDIADAHKRIAIALLRVLDAANAESLYHLLVHDRPQCMPTERAEEMLKALLSERAFSDEVLHAHLRAASVLSISAAASHKDQLDGMWSIALQLLRQLLACLPKRAPIPETADVIGIWERPRGEWIAHLRRMIGKLPKRRRAIVQSLIFLAGRIDEEYLSERPQTPHANRHVAQPHMARLASSLFHMLCGSVADSTTMPIGHRRWKPEMVEEAGETLVWYMITHFDVLFIMCGTPPRDEGEEG